MMIILVKFAVVQTKLKLVTCNVLSNLTTRRIRI